MPLTSADIALGVFTFCNTARVFAYVPQILKIGRDQQGATAISYSTWTLFGVSHLSTVSYALLVVDDWRMAAVFAANTLCCVLILGLTAWKRALFREAQKLLAGTGSSPAPALSVPGVSIGALEGRAGEQLSVGSDRPNRLRLVAG